jgi:hypothetical protein
MAIFYTDTGSFNSLTVQGSGSTLLNISGSSGPIFTIADTTASDATLFSVSTGSVNIFSVDQYKNVSISGSVSIIGSLLATASFANNITAYTINQNLSTTSQVIHTGVTASIRTNAGTNSTPPILIPTGTNLATASAGAIEYDGSTLYATTNTTSGRGEIPNTYIYRYTSSGSALGPTITDYFPANSSINLEANSFYDIECVAYFQKTTNGTVTWTWLASSAPSLMRSYYVGTAVAGFTTTAVTTAPVTAHAIIQSNTTLAHAATGTLTAPNYHLFNFKVIVFTNAATNIRLRVTTSAGSVTPQPGSYYIVKKLSSTTGNFAA